MNMTGSDVSEVVYGCGFGSADLGMTIAHVTLLAFVYCSTFWSP